MNGNGGTIKITAEKFINYGTTTANGNDIGNIIIHCEYYEDNKKTNTVITPKPIIKKINYIFTYNAMFRGNCIISDIQLFLAKGKVAGDVKIGKISVVRNNKISYFPRGQVLNPSRKSFRSNLPEL